jgi:hypothetical protein
MTSLLKHVVCASAVLALLGSSAMADDNVGVNAAIRNSVQEKSATQPALHPAVARGSVHLGDEVVSGDNSALQILLLDKSVFTVGANARMTIDKFVYDPSRGTSDVAASIAKGAFRFMSGPTLGGQGHNAISSPVATIGVRGTIVEGAVGADAQEILSGEKGAPTGAGSDTTTLVVLRGPGRNEHTFDKPGAIDVTSGGVTVSAEHAGDAIVIWGPNQPPAGPFTLSDGAFEKLSGLLRTTPGSGGPGQSAIFGDVGSAKHNSGDNLDVGKIGDIFTQDTTNIELPGTDIPDNR